MNSPQSVKIVDRTASDEDHQQYDQSFDQKPQVRRQIQDIVHRSDIEHYDHCRDGDQQ